jgi:hypothetical protein
MYKFTTIAALMLVSSVEGLKVNMQATRSTPRWIEREADQFINDWGNGTSPNVTKTDFDNRIAKEEKSSGENLTDEQKKAYNDEFDKADKNGDGVIDKEDMIAYFKAMYGYAQLSSKSQLQD